VAWKDVVDMGPDTLHLDLAPIEIKQTIQ